MRGVQVYCLTTTARFPAAVVSSSFYILIKKARNANDSSPAWHSHSNISSNGARKSAERKWENRVEWKLSLFRLLVESFDSIINLFQMIIQQIGWVGWVLRKLEV